MLHIRNHVRKLVIGPLFRKLSNSFVIHLGMILLKNQLSMFQTFLPFWLNGRALTFSPQEVRLSAGTDLRRTCRTAPIREQRRWKWLVIYWLSEWTHRNIAWVVGNSTGVTCICWISKCSQGLLKCLDGQDTQISHENRIKEDPFRGLLGTPGTSLAVGFPHWEWESQGGILQCYLLYEAVSVRVFT